MHRLLSTCLLAAVTLLSSVAPAPVLAAAPLPVGAVRLADGRVLLPPPAGLAARSVHAEMLDGPGAGRFDFGAVDPAATDGHPPSTGGRGAGAPTATTLSPADSSVEMGVLAARSLPNGLRKEVFGFLPYWMLTDSALGSLNLELLSTVAYFSVSANRDGALVRSGSGWTGWTSARLSDLIDRAHASGVRVVLTVTVMAWDSASSADMAALLGSSSARASLIGEIVAAVSDRGADGVNLDFEPVPTSLRSTYTGFVRDLKAALVAGGPGDYLTVSVTAGAATWATGTDVTALTANGAADALFVMGYDYHWSGSSRAGGVAPIDDPYTVDVNGTMNDFLGQAPADRLIWGVPYYGRTWPTSSDQVNATTLGGGSKAYYYTGHLAQAAQYGRRWDDVGKVPWYRWWNATTGNWVQGYYDDVESLGVKYDLVNARGLAGTGMWTLLMDQGRDDLWQLLADKFVTDSAPPVGGVIQLAPVTDGQAVHATWRVEDHASGLASVDVQVREVGSATWRAWLTATTATEGWYPGSPGLNYEFRASGIDRSGNRQPWTALNEPGPGLAPGTFARVAVGSLNLRTAAGTGYPVLTSLGSDELVAVIGGPVSSGGYTWWQLQVGFDEWPSTDYARIGWAAGGSGDTAYLVPTAPANRSRLDPFIWIAPLAPTFSPNGDGTRDSLLVPLRLDGDATDVQLEILDATGILVRVVDLGQLGAGSQDATWDGRTSVGGWAPAGRYLVRAAAVDASGGSHAAPAPGFHPDLLTLGVTADLTAPRMSVSSPAPGVVMEPAAARLRVTFDEAVVGVGPTRIGLRTAAGANVPASVVWDAALRQITVVPSAPLPTGASITAWIGPGMTDAAGNPVGAATWTFRTAPGTAYQPWRRATLGVGSHTAYVIGEDGTLRTPRSLTLTSAGSGDVGQRAQLPNLPGRWLYLLTGPFGRGWVRESANDRLAGETERTTYATPVTISLRIGTHTGYRFDAAGGVLATKTIRLAAAGTTNAGARAIINGRPYLLVVDGAWAGYWMPESTVAFRPGIIARIDFPRVPRLSIAPGTYTGYRFTSAGAVSGVITASLGRPSGANAGAWAIINGRPYFLVTNGIWAGTWLAEGSGVGVAVTSS